MEAFFILSLEIASRTDWIADEREESVQHALQQWLQDWNRRRTRRSASIVSKREEWKRKKGGEREPKTMINKT